MAVYNESKYIKDAVESILSQTFKNFEFIIVDDGSLDDTKIIIQSYRDDRIKLFSIEHGGLPRALNYGIKNSKSNLILRMDGDDISLKDRLGKQVSFLINNINCVAVGGAIQVIDKEGIILYHQKMPLTDSEIRKKLPIVQMYHSAIAFRKDVFFTCGGYDERLLTAQDQLLFNKMAEFGKLVNIEDQIMKYRIHPGAISRRSKKDNRILSQSLENIISAKKNISPDYDCINNIYLKYKRSRFKKEGLYFQTIGKIYIEKIFNRKNAFRNLLLSIVFIPFSMVSWYNILLLFLPTNYIKQIKNR